MHKQNFIKINCVTSLKVDRNISATGVFHLYIYGAPFNNIDNMMLGL